MAEFTPRLNDTGLSTSSYYNSNNPFKASGYGLPNCTCYAWGRFWECQGSSGSRPKLSLNNAEDWWGYTSDGYQRGQTPRVGAVICWRKGQAGNGSDGAGHVGIVEAVNDDGTIVTSESAYNGYYFRTKQRNPTANWDGGDYIFQGFIYNPVAFSGSGTSVEVPTPVMGNRYLTSEEMHTNATYIWWYLSQRGWTPNAVAGMLGNMEVESTINPGIWENLTDNPETFFDQYGRYPGYGLVQWTPYTKLTNWADSVGYGNTGIDVQLERIIWEQTNENGQFYSADTQYAGMTFTDFKESTLSPYELGMIFLTCYERPLDPNQPSRGENAEYWYEYITGLKFDDKTKKKKGLPIWMMCRRIH